jgi:hypothetical protein
VSKRLKTISIKALYPLALAEGEGVGTAYEYFAKRLVLTGWLTAARPGRILIAGLPQKYGSSLDFLLLAEELGRDVVVVDERPEAIEKIKGSLAAAKAAGLLQGVNPTYLQVEGLPKMIGLTGEFGFCISSEVLQRLSGNDRPAYWQNLLKIAPAAAVFAPNADNPAHTSLSGLNGLTLDELRQIVGTAATSNYIDMPPFPPGMTRSDDQREQATSGRVEALAMRGLAGYARLERFVPRIIRRSQAHIVFALSG